MRELGTELGLWERTANVLNRRGAVSPAPPHPYFKMTALFSEGLYYEIDLDVKITLLAFFSLAPGWPFSISCVFLAVLWRQPFLLNSPGQYPPFDRTFRPVTVTVNLPSCRLFFIHLPSSLMTSFPSSFILNFNYFSIVHVLTYNHSVSLHTLSLCTFF